MELAKETLQEVPGQLLNFFRTKGIQPNPATEVQKQLLQDQLQKQNSLGKNYGQEPIDEFFAQKKEEFLIKMKQMGIDAKDFVENKFMFSFDENVML